MFAILFSCIITSFICVSWGKMLCLLYNAVCQKNESYNIIEYLILGLISISIPLTIWSLWLPSNYIFLIITLIISVIYFIINSKKWKTDIKSYRDKIRSIPPYLVFAYLIFIFGIIFSCSWIDGMGDTTYYHHQQIKWNEQFAVVPGLGNLDDKFAFNSQYLLLSAIFAFRPLFDQAIYSLSPIFVISVMGWLIWEVAKSNYEAKRIILTIAYLFFIVISLNSVFDTSTDLLPNIIVFFMSALVICYPKAIMKKSLFLFSVPLLITICKISMLPFCLFSLFIIYKSMLRKDYSSFTFFISLGLMFCIPWFIRNIILSGYLVYPVYQIDIFSHDWKLPKEVAIKAANYVKFVAHEFIEMLIKYPSSRYRHPLYMNILIIFSYLTSSISVIALSILLIIKRKKQPLYYSFLSLSLIISFIIWLSNGPDIRFIHGVIYVSIAFAIISVFKKKLRYTNLKNISIISLVLFTIYFGSITIRRGYYNYETVKESTHRPYSSIIYKPYTREDVIQTIYPDYKSLFVPYDIGNGIIIYISYAEKTLEILPCTVNEHRGKFTDYRCLEPRGNSLQDGFRLKKNCK